MGIEKLVFFAGTAPYWTFRDGLRSLGFRSDRPEPAGDTTLTLPPEMRSGRFNETDHQSSEPRGLLVSEVLPNADAPPGQRPSEVYLEPDAALMLSLSHALQVGMLSIDQADRIVYVNQRLCSTFGLAAEAQALMMTPASLLYYSIARLTTDPTRTAQAMLDASRSDELPSRVEFTLTDGRSFGAICATVSEEANCRFWLFRPHRDAPTSADSDSNAMQLARLHERKTAMLSTASHEVRGTLHGILGLVDELRDGSSAAPDPELLDVLSDACTGLQSMVQQVLDLAQLETNVVTLSHDSFDLREVLRQVGAVVAGVLRGKTVILNLHIEPQCAPWRVGDVGRLRQILTNVATNAAKCTEHGVVSLSVSVTDHDTVRFVVADDGPGMPEFARDRLTAPLARRAGNAGNAGLGLLIARELIELLQGHVEVAARPGAGTTVDIEIPLPEAIGAEVGSPESGQSALFGRALLVDDAPEGLDFLSRALQPVGGVIDATGDTEQALGWASKRAYDLVILDGLMTPHDGADLARALRLLETTATSTIIVATANVGKISSARYLAAGADLVLVKPFAKTHLIESLRRLRPANMPEVEKLFDTALADDEIPDQASEPEARQTTTPPAIESPMIIDLRQSDTDGPAIITRRRKIDWDPHAINDLERPSELDRRSPQRQALQMFARAIDARMATIRSAIADQRGDDAADALHALASPAVVVGANRTGEYGLALETVTRSVGVIGLSHAAVNQLEILATAEVGELLTSGVSVA